MRDTDVEAAIRLVLLRANRRFDAAMDALVPPTSVEMAVRVAPGAFQLGQIVGSMAQALRTAAEAFSAGVASMSEPRPALVSRDFGTSGYTRAVEHEYGAQAGVQSNTMTNRGTR